MPSGCAGRFPPTPGPWPIRRSRGVSTSWSSQTFSTSSPAVLPRRPRRSCAGPRTWSRAARSCSSSPPTSRTRPGSGLSSASSSRPGFTSGTPAGSSGGRPAARCRAGPSRRGPRSGRRGCRRLLAAGAPEPYRYRNTDIKFAAAVLGRETPPRIACPGVDRRRTAPLSQLRRHTNRRIAVLAAVMSGDLGDAKSHVVKVCDGTARQPVFAVLPAYHVAPSNRPLLEAPYGSVLHLRDVLVRENARARAINLLVSRSSTITVCDR